MIEKGPNTDAPSRFSQQFLSGCKNVFQLKLGHVNILQTVFLKQNKSKKKNVKKRESLKGFYKYTYRYYKYCYYYYINIIH